MLAWGALEAAGVGAGCFVRVRGAGLEAGAGFRALVGERGVLMD